jgi:hypothetical protein
MTCEIGAFGDRTMHFKGLFGGRIQMTPVRSLQEAIAAGDVSDKVQKLQEVAEDAVREERKTAMVIRESKPNFKVVTLSGRPAERSGVRTAGDTEKLRALKGDPK